MGRGVYTTVVAASGGVVISLITKIMDAYIYFKQEHNMSYRIFYFYLLASLTSLNFSEMQ